MLWLLFFLVVYLTAVWPKHTIFRNSRPYLTRWPLLGGDSIRRAPWPLGLVTSRNVFVHWIRDSDDLTCVHSHPWTWAKSLILWGWYVELRMLVHALGVAELTRTTFGPGRINRLYGDTWHTIALTTPSVVTLFWTGPKHGRSWSFRDAR